MPRPDFYFLSLFAVMALLPPYLETPLILGAPAKVVRALTDADVANLERAASGYVERGAQFRTDLERVG